MTAAARLSPWLKTLGAVGILVAMLYPVYWLVSASFQPGASAATIQAIPPSFDLTSFRKAVDEQLGPILTSLAVAIGTALLSIVIAAPAAFGLSRLRSRFVDVVLITLFIAQIVPGIVLSNSLYTMFQSIGLLNTIPGLILANASGSLPFALLLLRSFMLEIDQEVLEAARLDGAGAVRTLLQIVAPISRNALITAGVFGFLAGWGDFLFALTLSTGSELKTMTVGVYEYISSPNVDWSTVMAASVLASLPAIVLLIVSQRYLRVGLGAGSGK
ncbi:carbohydrate ABC transporter permease [Galbitalea sp. SE-J8]|uniref:carbohydrate ABC transporter permease n=1 Tax=Galbitalea sp. SE-J8 TaxID=3054952 RepID=UPI00259CF3F1|nr:carbohydrate ABC transporter permease [Galbitalea sp. SE-J8]MDM4763564.1 carbohydrate ABC transporter permease [Galbitalea sp. SE-J8]